MAGLSNVTLSVIGLALMFAFLNGFQGSASVAATVISSRAVSPRRMLLLSASAHLVAPLVFGVAVATTIGNNTVNVHAVTTAVLLSALLSAIIWSVMTWVWRVPSSTSHALAGGLVGATVVEAGVDALQVRGAAVMFGALLLSPLLGLALGRLCMRVILFLVRGASPRINWLFKRGQFVTALSLALGHGSNDAQKAMGVITLALLADGAISDFGVPLWAVIASAAAMALGTSLGSRRLMRTVGAGFYRIRPVHGFAAQLASALIVLGAAWLGGPVSTTQVVNSAVIGVGSTERPSQVRWRLAAQVARAWLLTIPGTALLAALIRFGMSLSMR